jgi:hypothetical protein
MSIFLKIWIIHIVFSKLLPLLRYETWDFIIEL